MIRDPHRSPQLNEHQAELKQDCESFVWGKSKQFVWENSGLRSNKGKVCLSLGVGSVPRIGISELKLEQASEEDWATLAPQLKQSWTIL